MRLLNKKSILTKLIVYTSVIYAITLTLTTAHFLRNEAIKQEKMIFQRMEFAMMAFSSALSDAMWNISYDLVEDGLNDIIKDDLISGAKAYSYEGDIIKDVGLTDTRRPHDESTKTVVFVASEEKLIKFTKVMYKRDKDSDQEVGKIELFTTKQIIYDHIIDDSKSIILYGLINLIISLCIFVYVTFKFIHVPLRNLLTAGFDLMRRPVEEWDGMEVDAVGVTNEIKLIQDVGNMAIKQIYETYVKSNLSRTIERDLEIAKTVQELFIPHEHGILLDEVEFSAHYESSSHVGGDWYNTAYYDDSGTFIMYLGDVTGHGTPAAMMTAVLAGAFAYTDIQSRNFLYKDASAQLRHPDFLPTIVNRIFCNVARGEYLMTFQQTVVNIRTGVLTVCGAGHCPLLVLRVNNKGKIKTKRILQRSTPIGYAFKSRYDLEVFQLEPGDLIVSYTDGIFENEYSNEEMWGMRRFVHSLEKHFEKDITSLKEAVIDDMKAHVGKQPYADDVTLLLCRYEGQRD